MCKSVEVEDSWEVNGDGVVQAQGWVAIFTTAKQARIKEGMCADDTAKILRRHLG